MSTTFGCQVKVGGLGFISLLFQMVEQRIVSSSAAPTSLITSYLAPRDESLQAGEAGRDAMGGAHHEGPKMALDGSLFFGYKDEQRNGVLTRALD